MGDENTDLKRSINRYVARLFYEKEKTTKLLAYAYYKLDDLLSFLGHEQAKIGTALLEAGLKEEILEKDGIKVFFDEDSGILIDTLSEIDRYDLLIKRNKEIVERDILNKTNL